VDYRFPNKLLQASIKVVILYPSQQIKEIDEPENKMIEENENLSQPARTGIVSCIIYET
jgi:hypothetical protein